MRRRADVDILRDTVISVIGYMVTTVDLGDRYARLLLLQHKSRKHSGRELGRAEEVGTKMETCPMTRIDLIALQKALLGKATQILKNSSLCSE